MDLEPVGGLFNVEKLKARLKKRYPDHNFDIKPQPDTKCKARYLCNNKDKITYYDQEGNVFCGQRYKQSDPIDPYKWEWRECHALIKPAMTQKEYKDMQDDIF